MRLGLRTPRLLPPAAPALLAGWWLLAFGWFSDILTAGLVRAGPEKGAALPRAGLGPGGRCGRGAGAASVPLPGPCPAQTPRDGGGSGPTGQAWALSGARQLRGRSRDAAAGMPPWPWGTLGGGGEAGRRGAARPGHGERLSCPDAVPSRPSALLRHFPLPATALTRVRAHAHPGHDGTVEDTLRAPPHPHANEEISRHASRAAGTFRRPCEKAKISTKCKI